jgi:hypothetical protein
VKTLAILKSKLILISMMLLLWAIVATFFAGYYWLQYQDFTGRIGGIPIEINIGVDYGNLTRTWHNNTKALTGMTLFKATKSAFDITYNTASGFGAYITSINGMAFNATHGWVWWKLDAYTFNWTRIDIGCDAYAVADNETFLWYYESGWPPPSPN